MCVSIISQLGRISGQREKWIIDWRFSSTQNNRRQSGKVSIALRGRQLVNDMHHEQKKGSEIHVVAIFVVSLKTNPIIQR